MCDEIDCLERQHSELEALKGIFGDQLHILKKTRSKKKWQPLEVKLSLTPQQSGPSEVYAQIDLHVICSEEYPNKSPEIQLLNSRGLSNQQTAILLDELNDLMSRKRGDEVIFELCQHIREFLHANNKPSYGSFYDEMVQRQQMEKESQMQKKKIEEDKQRQILQEEIQRRQEALKAELRNFRDNRDFTSETSPQSVPSSPLERNRTLSKRRSVSTSESFENNFCEHKTLLLTFDNNKQERQIYRVQCLGHSKKGSVVFAGVDITSGELFAITEWVLKCDESDPEMKQNLIKQITSIEQELNHLYKLYHRNLIHFLNMRYSLEEKHLIIHILQEYVVSNTCSTVLKDAIALDVDRIRIIATEVLSALQFLHVNNVVHKDLRDTSIHITKSGVIKVSDYSIDKRLSDIYRASSSTNDKCQIIEDDFPTIHSRGGKKFDVYRLGIILLSLLKGSIVNEQTVNLDSYIQPAFRDFLSKCLIKEERSRWSVNELMEHSFIRTPIDKSVGLPQVNLLQSHIHEESEKPDVDVNTYLPLASGQSRLQTEFQVLKILGKGAFGDVLKVKNKLDDSFYAIKRIKLNPKEKQINRKITREVKLLSKLNHENVVRYYCSWIESTTVDSTLQDSSVLGSSNFTKTDTSEELGGNGDLMMDKDFGLKEKKLASLNVEWNVSYQSKSKASAGLSRDSEEENNSSDSDSDEEWPFIPRRNGKSKLTKSDSSDSIIFDHGSENDDKKLTEEEDEDDEEEEENTATVKEIQFMYIQMEFCEKSTLRTAIDNQLYNETDRMWRLFREIVEGLAHIHQQGMIHRDLKPVNIFIDSNDHVKIGDFGLATTNIRSTLGPNNNPGPEIQVISKGASSYLGDQGSMTGQVGTALYAAPELNSKVEKAIYNQKVDIYSLGIILLEMSYGPLNTGMERYAVLNNLRNEAIILPKDMEDTMATVAHLLKWLLNHDPSQRPTAQELLASDCLPQQEEAEFNERIRQIFSNKQSKQYKYLVECCFAQKGMTPAEDYTYDDYIPTNPNQRPSIIDLSLQRKVRSTIKKVFKQHGGRYIATPLLMPKSSHTKKFPESSVQIMSRSGHIVYLPHDLRTSLARYVVRNNIHRVRRYVIDRVYRERTTVDIHPRELFECAFDVISPGPQNLLQEAEMIYIVWEICNKISQLHDREFVVRLNHTSLLQAVLMYCGIEQDKYEDVYAILCDARDGKFSKFQVQTHLMSLCLTDQAMDILINLFDTESHIEKITNVLKTITKRKGDASAIAKEGLDSIQQVIMLAEELGVKWPLIVAPLMVQNVQHYSGVIYQISCESEGTKHKRKRAGRDVIAAGGRYNKLINSFNNIAVNFQGKRNGVGISISLDKLLYAIFKATENIEEDFRSDELNVVVCKEASDTRSRDLALVVKEIWPLNLQVDCSDFTNVDEALEYCAENQIKYVIVQKEGEHGCVKVYTLEKDRYRDRKVSSQEIAEHMQRQLENAMPTLTRSESKTSNNENFVPSNTSRAHISYCLFEPDKLSGSSRRSIKNNVLAQMESTLSRVSNKLPIEVIVANCEMNLIKCIVVVLKIDDEEQEFQRSIQEIIDEYPRHKKNIIELCEKMRRARCDDKTRPILALYSYPESRYTVMI